jgi:hypothetical protein
MDAWKAIVERVQRSTVTGNGLGIILGIRKEEWGEEMSLQKNMYWKTIGCWASRPKLLAVAPAGSASGTDWRSMRAQVR